MTTKVPQNMLESDVPSAAQVAALVAALVPVGAIIDYAGTSVPAASQGIEFAFPYGQAISRTTYATLFDRLGTTYGTGNGSTTFNLPDLRGRVGVGKDDMGGSAANRVTEAVSGITGTQLGESGGDQRMQAHEHEVSAAVAQSGSGASVVTGGTGVDTTTVGEGASQNMQPSLIVNKLIRIK